MNLNDFSKWLQYNRVKNLRGSEYFPYPLCIYLYFYIYIYINNDKNQVQSRYVDEWNCVRDRKHASRNELVHLF